MKFLCRNCKAKYQIADEKVVGRTLRMSCQQCGEQIVVRGPGARATTGGVSRPMGQPLVPPPPPAPSALGVDFQRQVAQTGHEAPAARPQDEWHVAINDVPVGPMRRDEVARKITAGAVDRESLAWREGMDDWLPVKHIPELFSLIERPAPAVQAPSVANISAPPVQPAARAPMAPIGGRQVMSLEDYAPPQEVVAPAVVEPAVTVSQVSEPASGGKPLGWAQMFALVSGGALIMMVGAVLGVKMLAPPAAAPTAHAPGAAGAAAPAPAPATARDPEPAAADQGSVIELDMQAIDGESAAETQRRTGSASGASTDKKAASGKQLTEEQKAMLARMGGSLDQGPNLRAPSEQQRSSSGGGGGGQLTAEQLSQVVLRGRKNLQRCYETALRGANSDETVRMDVDIEVSPSGNVTSVRTTGKGLPGMEECLTRTVRMWRFPSSGDGAQTRFPVVFQPGG